MEPILWAQKVGRPKIVTIATMKLDEWNGIKKGEQRIITIMDIYDISKDFPYYLEVRDIIRAYIDISDIKKIWDF